MSKKKHSREVSRQKKQLLFFLCAAIAILIVVIGLLVHFIGPTASNVAIYKEKLALLESSVLTAETEQAVGSAPAGEQPGQVVFLSVCDTTERASVFCGTGSSLRAAWSAADKKVTEFLKNNRYDPVWVKADVVYVSNTVPMEELEKKVREARHEFFRFGIAFDQNFQTALLEAELNGAKIYDYGDGGVDLKYLNQYLKKAGRTPLEELPETCRTFKCMGWFCDESKKVYELNTGSLDYGRRKGTVDGDYAQELIMNASAFLEAQIQEDGSFIYGIYPRFDNEIENYNIVRHASTLWSLICRYRLAPDNTLAEEIERTISFMLNYVIFDSENRAYLYEEKTDEIKLGGCGVAVVALTEYMDVFQNEKYKELCGALGDGILSMLDQETGEYYHILNGDFSRKEEFRTVYYDGEATFALCRLYSLTHDSVWLNAAQSAVAHFIEADYTQYKDHWVAYSMNEITKYITDDEEYYAFALNNAERNLREIRDRDTTYHTYLELLMATFEVYNRMTEHGIQAADFDLQALLDTISVRVDRQLNGYFYPEYAMYMKNPQRILNTFMVRHDGYRVRIDDVQHNIGGLYLYAKNYDKMVALGLPSAVPDAIDVPAQVTGLTAQARDGGVKLSWNATEGVDGYCIFRWNEDTAEYRAYKFSENPSKTFSGLTNGKEYTFVVASYRIENSQECYGTFSDPVRVIPLNDKLKLSESYLVMDTGDSYTLSCLLFDQPQEGIQWPLGEFIRTPPRAEPPPPAASFSEDISTFFSPL